MYLKKHIFGKCLFNFFVIKSQIYLSYRPCSPTNLCADNAQFNNDVIFKKTLYTNQKRNKGNLAKSFFIFKGDN